jgi:VIT1/CCC1 family predicted Fe2+/Mn2+ transporter
LIPDEESPFKNSLVTFFSFCIFGIMPLIPFIVASASNMKVDYKLAVASICISVFFLFVLGFGKSFVTSAKWYWSALETIFIGAVSAAAAYGVGVAFNA